MIATVFPLFEGPRKIPVQGTCGTTPSRGCFEAYWGVAKSLTGPMFYPQCLVALEAHAALWIAGGGCDLFAQLRGHAVQLALGLLVALGGLGVDAVREGVAAVPLAAHAA